MITYFFIIFKKQLDGAVVIDLQSGSLQQPDQFPYITKIRKTKPMKRMRIVKGEPRVYDFHSTKNLSTKCEQSFVSAAEFTGFIELGFVFLFRGGIALITCHNSF